MLLHVVARGRIGRSPEGELVTRYAARIAWPLRITELADDGRPAPALAPPARVTLLDERGENLASEALAQRIGAWREAGVREARFVLGGADGHGEDARGAADLLLGFGRATWPHLLARAMLLEQLYRATTILAGHPYHRAG